MESVSSEDDYESLLEAVPIEEMWLQDRRAHSTGLPSYEGFPGKEIIALFRQYTRFYKPPIVDFVSFTSASFMWLLTQAPSSTRQEILY